LREKLSAKSDYHERQKAGSQSEGMHPLLLLPGAVSAKGC
jgi:hypothetical protein